MRIFAIPAAALIACCLYLPLPKAAKGFDRLLSSLYAQVLRLFTRKSGAADAGPALCAFLLLLGGVSALLSAIHPLLAMVLMAPLFSGLAALPACVHMEHELSSGTFADDIPTYEALVRETCASVAPAFVSGVVAPLLLCAVGMPLHLAVSLGYIHAALCALHAEHPRAAALVSFVHRAAEHTLVFFLTLCSGAAGRNPLRVKGREAKARLLSIIGIAGDGTDTHAPMAGDIAQAIFLCAFASSVLCLTLCAVGFFLC